LFGDQMSYFGWVGAEVKGAGALLGFAIFGGHSFVLAQMLGLRAVNRKS
jgi:hypothetical protein